MTQRTIVAFIHSFMPDGRLDPFMNGLVSGFLDCGANVHLILANDLVFSLGATNYAPYIDPRKVDRYVRSVKPDFIFSSNRAGICPSLIQNPPCPILTWFVDLIPFMHHGGTAKDLFGKRDHVITSTSKNVSLVERDYPALKGRVHYMPFATNAEDFKKRKRDAKDIPISFIGTFFYAAPILNLCLHYKNDEVVYKKLLTLMGACENSFDLDIEKEIDRLDLRELIQEKYLSPLDVKFAISNAISASSRFTVLTALADLGLHLYGTENWIHSMSFSTPLFRCFRAWDLVNTREKLIDIYQRSKISINISHQQAMGGLPYRIFDIMASDSMLLADEESRHDLELLFGKNCPVPLFRTPQEARALAEHYLKHEEERLEIVAQCQKLVATGFHFRDRARTMFDIAETALEKNPPKGALIRVDRANFIVSWSEPLHKLLSLLPPSGRSLFLRVIRKILGPSAISSIKNFLRR